jgi:hypothetical protein
MSPYRIAPVHVLEVVRDPFRYCGKLFDQKLRMIYRNYPSGIPIRVPELFHKICNLAYMHAGPCDHIYSSSTILFRLLQHPPRL